MGLVADEKHGVAVIGQAVLQVVQDTTSRQRSAGSAAVDGTPKSVLDQPREVSGVVDMGMGQDEGTPAARAQQKA